VPDGQQSNLPKSSTILIIRHGEQSTEGGSGLAPAGRERALKYVDFFQKLPSPARNIDYIFAAANSSASCRPQLTILPAAAALDLPIADQTADKEYARLADAIGLDPSYAGSTLLICWHHEHALKLAQALGVQAGVLLGDATWPESWPGGKRPGEPNVYGWMLIIVSAPDGSLDVCQTRCINTLLMPDDKGQDPPCGRALHTGLANG
jgi:hypothetical protein